MVQDGLSVVYRGRRDLSMHTEALDSLVGLGDMFCFLSCRMGGRRVFHLREVGLGFSLY